MNSQKRILFTIHEFQFGGITTALLNMLSELTKLDKYNIDLLLFKKASESFKTIPKGINILYGGRLLNVWFSKANDLHGLDRVLWFFFSILKKIFGGFALRPFFWIIRKKNNEYDYAVSYENDIPGARFASYTNDYVLKKVKAKAYISFIHNDPFKLGFTNKYIHKAYKSFDKLIFVSNGCMQKFCSINSEYATKTAVLYNFIPNTSFNFAYKEQNDVFKIITICRLYNEQKRVDRAIEAADILKRKNYRIVWDIFGDGPDFAFLKSLIDKKGLADTVIMHGRTNEALKEISKHDIFILTSDYEAFGVVLKEALCAGVPVITTNFEEAHETIKNMKNGIIIDKNPDSIADAVSLLIDKPESLHLLVNYIKENPETNKQQIKQFLSIFGD